MNLEKEIKQLISVGGPIPIDHFMKLAIEHYYKSQTPFGKLGDFITAPEISQMFGEIIGIWCANLWDEKGKPRFTLVELGPGKGTLMSDFLRGTKNIKGFHDSIDKLVLVEISEKLKEAQNANIDFPRVEWKNNLSEIEESNCIVICNEFLDALPIKQYVKEHDTFHELFVGLKDNDNLEITKSPLQSDLNINCDEQSIIEKSPYSDNYAKLIESKTKNGGAALIIDYGYTIPPYKSTLQALKKHKNHPLLSDIGEADITALVDFTNLLNNFPNRDTSLLTQSEFLISYGINLRAKTLISSGADAKKIESELNRLLSSSEMGDLFKVLEVK